MLKRHHDTASQMSPSAQPKLKALLPKQAKQAQKIKNEIKALEQELERLLGVNCKLKIFTTG